MFLRIRLHKRSHAHTSTHPDACLRACKATRAHTATQDTYMHVCTHEYVHIHKHARIRVHAHKVHVHMRARMQTHIRVQIQ